MYVCQRASPFCWKVIIIQVPQPYLILLVRSSSYDFRMDTPCGFLKWGYPLVIQYHPVIHGIFNYRPSSPGAIYRATPFVEPPMYSPCEKAWTLAIASTMEPWLANCGAGDDRPWSMAMVCPNLGYS